MAALEEEREDSHSSQMAFVSVLSRFTILLEKSQKPHLKTRKAEALLSFRKEIELLTGKEQTNEKISKKIANMKKIVKEKTDLKQTGNKTIKLKPWERKMFELLQGDINPIFCRIEGAQSCGLGITKEAEPNEMHETPQRAARKRMKPSCLPDETEETKSLTTAELQRCVLLEQLKYYRIKTRLMMEKQAFSRASDQFKQ